MLNWPKGHRAPLLARGQGDPDRGRTPDTMIITITIL